MALGDIYAEVTAVGIQGLSGAGTGNGATGSTGPQGASGATGPAGGPTGASGEQGASGTAGSTGPQGASGIGASGVGGASGVAGASGVGGGSVTVSNISGATGGATGSITNTVTGVTALRFDKDTGFNVSDLGSGEVKVSLGSAYKTIKVAGQSDLVATGEDTLEVIAGTGVTITTNAGSNPKALTINATGGAGATGTSGVAGASGYVGMDGASGVTGASGAAGLDGATGPQGIGATGLQGASGIRGTTGPQGASGIHGASGATGITGASGAAGAGAEITSFTTVSTNEDLVDVLDVTLYRSAKYDMQLSSGSDFAVTELRLLHDKANVFLTEYGSMGEALGNFATYYSPVSNDYSSPSINNGGLSYWNGTTVRIYTTNNTVQQALLSLIETVGIQLNGNINVTLASKFIETDAGIYEASTIENSGTLTYITRMVWTGTGFVELRFTPVNAITTLKYIKTTINV
jgi:hypothetical protein